MKLRQFDNPSQFYEQVKDYLAQQEALHCLILGIASTLAQAPQQDGKMLYFASVETEEDVVAVALRTPPQKLLLSQIKDFKAIDAIAKDLYVRQTELPGVSAPVTEAKAFAEAWQALTGQSYYLSLKLRIYQLQTVQPVPQPSGYLRQATRSDRTLLVQWYDAFAREVGIIAGNAEQYIDHHLGQKTLYFWEDEVPVSVVSGVKSTPNGYRISLAYTPPEYRRKGYATAGVAQLSQDLLNRGCHFCFLFTDLANPTANHIYQTIGYQPVADWNEYSFHQ